MKIIFIHLLFFLFLLSCKKDYIPVKIDCTLTRDIDSIKTLLPGTWNWLEEKSYNQRKQKFEYLTPRTEGYSSKLKFEANKATFYKNDRMDSVYLYDVVRMSTITNIATDNLPCIVFYRINTGVRSLFVPVKACSNFMVLEYQYVSSLVGEKIWEKQ